MSTFLSVINCDDIAYVIICCALSAILIAALRHTVQLVYNGRGLLVGLPCDHQVSPPGIQKIGQLARDDSNGSGCQGYQKEGNKVKVDVGTQVEHENYVNDVVKQSKKAFASHVSQSTNGDAIIGNGRTGRCYGNCGSNATIGRAETGSVTSHLTEQRVMELNKKVKSLENQLEGCQATVTCLRNSEQELKNRLSDQTRRQFETSRDVKVKGYRFEDITLDDKSRPTRLIRRYNDLYSEARVELLDVLDQLPLDGSTCSGNTLDDGWKNDLILLCIVYSFEQSERSLQAILTNVKSVLLPSYDGEDEVDDDDDGGRRGARRWFPTQVDSVPDDDLPPDIVDGVSAFLVQTANRRNINSDVETILDRLFSTSSCRDHSALRQHTLLIKFIKTCFRLAWTLTVLQPPYQIIYDVSTDKRLQFYSDDRHKRYHTSDPDSSDVKSVIWPGLEERETGFCVCKAMVKT